MNIEYKQAIIHVLDEKSSQPIISNGTLEIYEDNESFLTKHMLNLFDNINVSPAQFNDDSDLLDLIVNFHDGSFLDFSKIVAQKFYDYMRKLSSFHGGDLLFTHFIKDDLSYLGIFLLNYKDEFTHKININSAGTGTTEIIKCHGILPSKQRVTEAVLINLETRQLNILDKSKEPYLCDLLDLDKEMSIKEKIDVIDEATREIILENFDNPTETLANFKTHIATNIIEHNEIPVQKIIDDTFFDLDEIKEACQSRISEYGLKDDKIVIENAKEAKKYVSHQIKTDTGIELKLPTELANNVNVIEFLPNEDGTTNIILKNISEFFSK